MAGSADVIVTASPPKDGQSEVHASLSGTNLDVAMKGGRRIKQSHVQVVADAIAALDNTGGLRSVRATAWSVDAGPGQLKGDAALARKGAEWTYRATWSGGGSLGPLAEAVAGLTGSQPGLVTGQWKLSGDVDTGAATGTAVNVTASTTNLAVAQAGGAPTKLPDVRLLAAATLAKDDSVQVRKLDLTGPGLTLQASGAVRLPDAAKHQGATGDGSVSLDADLAQLTDVLRPLGVLDKESIMAGKAKLNGRAASAKTGFSGSGTFDVTGLSMHIVGPDLTLVEPSVHVPIAFSYATAEDLWKIAIKGMKSGIASGDVDGSLGTVAGKTSLQARCDIRCDGEKVQAAVRSHLPKEMLLSKSWHVVGQASGPLRPQGSWNQRIADLTGEGTVDLGTFDYQGLTGDQGKVQLALANGRLALVHGAKEGSRFRLNEGTVVLGGNADMNASPAPYTLAEKLLVIDSVKLNEKITSKFLKFTSPILHLSVKPTGLLYASLTEARIPLGEGIAQHSDLRGQVWIKNFQAEISGPLATLIQWAGGKTQLPTQELGPFDLDLRDGVFYVKDQTLKLQEDFELEINGTISLEGPIDITVTMPLTGPMLKKFGVSEKNLTILADQELQVPIRGTIDKPKLDEAALAAQIAKLGLEASKREGMKDIGKMIEDALNKKKKTKKTSPIPIP